MKQQRPGHNRKRLAAKRPSSRRNWWAGMKPYAGQETPDPIVARIAADVRKATVALSSNPDCPACASNRFHGVSEWQKYHPEAGKGFSREHGAPLKKEPSK